MQTIQHPSSLLHKDFFIQMYQKYEPKNLDRDSSPANSTEFNRESERGRKIELLKEAKHKE
ncbi:MAG: hypothetical protein QNJ70_13730 [Xenococcaceae cyanobacterium MO_207.B15]|nr:hypothetical protein [Xenococcaceae cyanobacterium MO_207.B15]